VFSVFDLAEFAVAAGDVAAAAAGARTRSTSSTDEPLSKGDALYPPVELFAATIMSPHASTKEKREFFSLVSKASHTEAKILMKCLNQRGRDILYDCAYNIQNNPTIPQSKRDEIKSKLADRRSQKQLLSLADYKIPDDKRRRVLEQHGGALFPLLASIALPLISEVISGLASK
jgi:hypothetical protein